MFFESPQFGEHFCPKNSSQHQTSTACIRTCRRNRATPPLPRSPVRFLTSTPKPRAEGSSPSAPAKKERQASACLSFFVSVPNVLATWHGCALRSACRGGLQPGGLRPGPTEAAAETSPSLDFLLAFRVFSSGFTRSQLFPSSPAPKTHPISPFWGFSGCVSLFLSSFDLQNFRAGFCAGCHSHSFTTPSYMPQYLSSIYSFPPVAPDSSQLTVFPART